VFGRQFVLGTHHKPLVSIFGESKGIPTMAAHRLQRYAVFLTGYSYKIEFINGVNNCNADALSRLPIKGVYQINDAVCDNFFINLKYLSMGHMSPAKSHSSYFIPHHAVFKANDNEEKLRVVFYASA
jgi:hypothetical protein